MIIFSYLCTDKKEDYVYSKYEKNTLATFGYIFQVLLRIRIEIVAPNHF